MLVSACNAYLVKGRCQNDEICMCDKICTKQHKVKALVFLSTKQKESLQSDVFAQSYCISKFGVHFGFIALTCSFGAFRAHHWSTSGKSVPSHHNVPSQHCALTTLASMPKESPRGHITPRGGSGKAYQGRVNFHSKGAWPTSSPYIFHQLHQRKLPSNFPPTAAS